MSDETGPNGEPIGSVGEEAAKLFAALSGLAKGAGTDFSGTSASAAGAMSDAMHNLNEHIATGGEDCKYCPVCQLITVVRTTSPEVKAHLAVAASSLMQAAAGVLATQVPSDAKTSPVEKINLDDDGGWDES
ncbi:hypothetical protein EFK50_06765 [Nocardioides marmoriginsengisoli]|uniref:Uncharacterized protein n=1 Tax=Nocardioides marmoriginsengisoli TaxID=661483 RepID=A0A3N0CLK7_9ACTN|nr:hypothetical protein [Nocardioides marmoriginsengisoli]RNL64229.1 hypothetical protein EFK50_06765 [Nocardioides marmoriginsengisoli]